MKTIIVASLAFALGGCLSVPHTPTAANDDACLRKVMDKYSGAGACESLRATWNRVGYQSSTRNQANGS